LKREKDLKNKEDETRVEEGRREEEERRKEEEEVEREEEEGMKTKANWRMQKDSRQQYLYIPFDKIGFKLRASIFLFPLDASPLHFVQGFLRYGLRGVYSLQPH
jgi:hypothetical protein